MAMSPMLFLSVVTLIIVAKTSLTSTHFTADESGDDDNLSAYQIVEQYGFPVGILPKGVTSYEIDRDTGEFKASWGKTCSFSLEGSYSLRYDPTITGVIAKNKLRNLKGVSVKVLFFWLGIVEVTRVGDDLQFSVGIVSASFPVFNFVESPQCGCGFVCRGSDEEGSSSVMSS